MTPEESMHLDQRIINSLKEYKGTSKFQKEAMNALVKTLPEKDIENLIEGFKRLDKDNTGYINCEELKHACSHLNIELAQKEIEHIIENVDYYGNGKINYSEFLAATISTKQFLTEEKLWALFKHFDIDNSGYITHENLKNVLKKTGQKISDAEIEDMIREFDQEKNKMISFEEFSLMLKQLAIEPKEQLIPLSTSVRSMDPSNSLRPTSVNQNHK